MTIQEISEGGTHQEAEEVVLDGNSFVANWPLDHAEALLTDLTPWWMTWPTLATEESDPKVRYMRLANCVYGYCRYPKLVNLLKAPLILAFSTQQLLDGIYFLFRRERFQGDACDWAEPLFRQALQEVIRRVRSDHPPRFLTVTRQDYWLMDGDTRLGVLTPSGSQNGILTCHFAADSAFASIHPLFEEAYHLMETRRNWRDWDTSHQRVAALGLTLLREDEVSMGLNALRIHEEEASFYLSKELL